MSKSLILWIVSQACVSYNVSNPNGTVETQPRWRVVGFVWSQLAVLPTLLILRDADTFKLGFPLWMCFDFVCVPLSARLCTHHILCLTGHLLGVLHGENFFVYMLGVCLLEAGSAAVNFECVGLMTHRVCYYCMTLSNMSAAVCILAYVFACGHVFVRALCIPMGVSLLGTRQLSVGRA